MGALPDRLRIIELRAENIKRLQAVAIRPEGNVVQITGKNGNGKTSVLDAIWWAIEGATHIQAEPIRKGADRARIRLDLGELIVTRTFNAKEEGGGFTTTLTVQTADGFKSTTPQTVLDALAGELAFDPLEFTRMKPEGQFAHLRSFVPDVDFAEVDRLNAKDYTDRTDTNRQAKAAKAQAEAIVVPEDAPAEEVDVAALATQLEEATAHNARVERSRDLRAQAEREVEEIDRQIGELVARRDDLKKRLEEAPALPELKDPAGIRAQIDGARAKNAAVANARRKAELLKEVEGLEAKSAALTKAMDDRDAARSKAIAAAKMPVEGLGFGSGFVTLNGHPFDQASDAEQLAASMAIAAAMNPRLRVIRVRDGSLLDDDAMRQLEAFADAQDLQVWIERVDSSGKVGVVLEDGLVKGAPVPEVEEPKRKARAKKGAEPEPPADDDGEVV